MEPDPIARAPGAGRPAALGCPLARGQAAGLLWEESPSTAEEQAGARPAAGMASQLPSAGAVREGAGSQRLLLLAHGSKR